MCFLTHSHTKPNRTALGPQPPTAAPRSKIPVTADASRPRWSWPSRAAGAFAAQRLHDTAEGRCRALIRAPVMPQEAHTLATQHIMSLVCPC
mgnify:CR=1 FL=1